MQADGDEIMVPGIGHCRLFAVGNHQRRPIGGQQNKDGLLRRDLGRLRNNVLRSLPRMART